MSWVRQSSAGVVPLAITVGTVVGVAAVGFQHLIVGITTLITGYADFSTQGRVGNGHFAGIGFWFVVLAPMAVGAVYGPMVAWLAPEARGHGVPEVMFAVAERGGYIPARVPVVKSLASALCIGGGGSVGREGPIVQIGAALGSSVAQVLRLETSRMRLLVACGAAAGISATFNAPLAGPFFAMELILRSFAAESFGAVVLASVTANVLSRAMTGGSRFLSLPTFVPHGGVDYVLFAVVGVVVGVVGVVFSRVLYLVEDACDWAWRGPEWLRPVIGGALLGGMLWALPQLYGVGYPVLEGAIGGQYALWLLAALMAGKILATSITIGIGGSGGVFAPTLFIGAAGGTALGMVFHALYPSVTGPVGAYGLVGMAAALAGATRAPITAVIILFELTGEYSLIVPLMAAVAFAAGVSHLLATDTIYTRKLVRRGVDVGATDPDRTLDLEVTSVASSPPPFLLPTATRASAARAMRTSETGAMPVVDRTGVYRGMLATHDLADALTRETSELTIESLVTVPPTVRADATLRQAIATFDGSPASGVPVVADDDRLVAWLSHKDVVNASGSRPRR